MEQSYWVSLSQRAASEPPISYEEDGDGRLSPVTVSSPALSCSESQAKALERNLDSKKVYTALHTDGLTLPALGGRPQTKTLPTLREISQQDGWFDSDNPQRGDGVVRFPPSLSVYNAPTATYAWPRLQPASEMSGSPVIFVKYANSETPSPPPTYSATPSPQPSDCSRSPKRSREDSESDPELPAYVDTRPDHVLSRSATTVGVSVTTSQLDRLRLSSRDASPIPEGNRYPPIPAPVSSRASSMNAIINGGSLSRSSSRTEVNWEHYAVRERRNGVTVFRCRWVKEQDGKHGECGYTAQKQLVKRHIDTTHLRKKFPADPIFVIFVEKPIHRKHHLQFTVARIPAKSPYHASILDALQDLVIQLADIDTLFRITNIFQSQESGSGAIAMAFTME
ncbi:hypothetical protein AX16_003136 [Volvariella volvacea WC 439]|nr:hypothetical protein AX16_003136 [Volvariella volvacea WC 439]